MENHANVRSRTDRNVNANLSYRRAEGFQHEQAREGNIGDTNLGVGTNPRTL